MQHQLKVSAQNCGTNFALIPSLTFLCKASTTMLAAAGRS